MKLLWAPRRQAMEGHKSTEDSTEESIDEDDENDISVSLDTPQSNDKIEKKLKKRKLKADAYRLREVLDNNTIPSLSMSPASTVLDPTTEMYHM